jgi:hypothetical protein
MRKVTNLELITTREGVSLQNIFCETGINAKGWVKSSSDFSLLGIKFTQTLKDTELIAFFNGTELPTLNRDTTLNFAGKGNADSVNNELLLKSGTSLNDKTTLESKRTPFYQENRGIIYSSSIFLPTPNALGIRRFGIFTQENGVFFELNNGQLFAVIRSLGVDWHRENITQFIVDNNIDLSKGNIYDIQLLWRGVGNVNFFIGNPETGLSLNIPLPNYKTTLFNRNNLTISNPTLPIAYECINQGNEVVIKSGCADLSSEGGEAPKFGIKIMNITKTNIKNKPNITFKVANNFQSGERNTINYILARIGFKSEKKGTQYVFVSRNKTLFNMPFVTYYDYETPLLINSTATTPTLQTVLANINPIIKVRLDNLETKAIDNPLSDGDFWLYSGDIISIYTDVDGEVTNDIWIGQEK